MALFYHTVIVGGGPSGLAAAKHLMNYRSACPQMKVLLLEKGQPYRDRLVNNNPDVLTGLGGAGTLGGGKLCFPPASKGIWKKTQGDISKFNRYWNTLFDVKIQKKNENNTMTPQLSANSVMWEKQYASSLLLKDEMNEWIQSLIACVKELVDVRCYSNFAGFEEQGNYYKVEFTDEGGNTNYILTKFLVIATGRSSSQDIPNWFTNRDFAYRCPDLGVRITVERSEAEKFFEIGRDVKIKALYGKDISTRTFCVCSGGEEQQVALNGINYFDGHFGSNISSNVNLGILTRCRWLNKTEDAFAYSKRMQQYLHSEMSLLDFIRYKHKLISEDSRFDVIFDSVEHFALQMLRMGFIDVSPANIQLHLPSIDNLNPYIVTNSRFETRYRNVYVIGDAAGISRGFVQAMWSGMCAADSIIEKVFSQEVNNRWSEYERFA